MRFIQKHPLRNSKISDYKNIKTSALKSPVALSILHRLIKIQQSHG